MHYKSTNLSVTDYTQHHKKTRRKCHSLITVTKKEGLVLGKIREYHTMKAQRGNRIEGLLI
jgi:hypothetical protein